MKKRNQTFLVKNINTNNQRKDKRYRERKPNARHQEQHVDEQESRKENQEYKRQNHPEWQAKKHQRQDDSPFDAESFIPVFIAIKRRIHSRQVMSFPTELLHSSIPLFFLLVHLLVRGCFIPILLLRFSLSHLPFDDTTATVIVMWVVSDTNYTVRDMYGTQTERERNQRTNECTEIRHGKIVWKTE